MKIFVTLILIAIAAASVSAKECFDDKNLLDLQASMQPRGTLVYVWSPRMGFSMSNATTAFQAAADAGLDFIVLHDAGVPGAELKQAMLARQAIEKSCASAASATPQTQTSNAARSAPPSLSQSLAQADARAACEQKMLNAAASHQPTPTSSIAVTSATTSATASATTSTSKITTSTMAALRGISLSVPSTGFGFAVPLLASPLGYSRPLCSEKLIQSEALRHFPTAFVIGKQGIHANPIVGAMPKDAWLSSIQQRLAPP